MSFSPPETYASKATTGYQSTFSIGSPLVALLELTTWSVKPLSVPKVKATHLLSPNNTQEYNPGMIEPGTIEFEGNYIGDSSQTTILGLAQAQTIFNFEGIAPMQRGAKTLTGTGVGFISEYSEGPFENDKNVQFKGTIQIGSGGYSETVA